MYEEMDIEIAKEYKEIIDAYIDGKTIQILLFQDMNNKGKWKDIVHPTFDFYNEEYRVKKEPVILIDLEKENEIIKTLERENCQMLNDINELYEKIDKAVKVLGGLTEDNN